jgi:hypothetical protein
MEKKYDLTRVNPHTGDHENHKIMKKNIYLENLPKKKR